MRAALHAEWTKLRTVAAPRWLLLATIAATVALGAATMAVLPCTAVSCGADPTRLRLSGVALGQAPVVVLGGLVISAEYGSGLVRTTLAAMPRRTTVLAAKAGVLAGVVAATAAVAVLGSLLLAHPSPIDGATLRAAVGSVLYLALIALLSLGVATAVRDAATGAGVVLGLLYLVPLLATVIGDPHGQRLLEQLAPMTAGLAIQTTTDLADLPIGPWAGLGVTALWAAAALGVGGLVLHVRDA